MDILKLAAEMDFNSIKAYKLDALKSVRKTNEARNLGVADNHTEAIEIVAEDSDSCHATVDTGVTSAGEDSSTTTVMQTGEEHVIFTQVFFLHFSSLCQH